MDSRSIQAQQAQKLDAPVEDCYLQTLMDRFEEMGVAQTYMASETIRPMEGDEITASPASLGVSVKSWPSLRLGELPLVACEGDTEEIQSAIHELPEILSSPRTTPSLPEEHPRKNPLVRLGEDKHLDQLHFMEVIGEGGMGIVQRAWQRALEREVAVKRVKGHLQASRSQRSSQALLKEARVTGKLEHPNIIPVHALGRSEKGEPLMVMKCIEGVTWAQLLAQRDHPLWVELRGDHLSRNFELLRQVCRAIEFAHSRGILHLDMKPENVMVGSFGEVYLVDWGISIEIEQRALYAKGSVAGTPAYIPPELLEGRGKATERSDIFLLGATLHEVLTGAPRHPSDSALASLMLAAESKPYDYPTEIPKLLGAICNKACNRDPNKRFKSARKFREAIEDFLSHRGAANLEQAARAQFATFEEKLRTHPRGNAFSQRLREEISTLSSNARFGFEQALREWPGFSAATEGLQRCLECMIGYELDRYNVEAVGPLLDALQIPNTGLQARYEEQRKTLGVELAARIELEEIRRESRFRGKSAKSSIALLSNGSIWLVGLFILGELTRSGDLVISTLRSFQVAVALSSLLVILMFLLKDLFFENKIRRAFSVGFLTYFTAFVLTRGAAYFLDMPLEHVNVADFVTLYSFLGMLAVLLHRGLFIAMATSAVGLLLCTLNPAYQFEIGGITLFLINFLFAYLVRPLPKQDAPVSISTQ